MVFHNQNPVDDTSAGFMSRIQPLHAIFINGMSLILIVIEELAVNDGKIFTVPITAVIACRMQENDALEHWVLLVKLVSAE